MDKKECKSEGCVNKVGSTRPKQVKFCDECLKERTITAHIEMELPMMKVKF